MNPVLAWGGGWGTSELRSTGPNLVQLLTTRCLHQGVHLKTKDSLLQTEDVLLTTKDGLEN